jgi:conserved oligomeric Golgi complex subunit 5
VVDRESIWIVQAEEEVVNSASRLLLQGMETQNQTEVANALQVFYNMQTLHTKVATIVEMIHAKV